MSGVSDEQIAIWQDLRNAESRDAWQVLLAYGPVLDALVAERKAVVAVQHPDQVARGSRFHNGAAPCSERRPRRRGDTVSVSDPRRCPHCDSDTYFAQNFERVRDAHDRLKTEYERQAAQHAVERAKWQLAEFDRDEQHKFIQGKARRQRLVINRLERRLRELGKVPHATDPEVPS